MQQLRGRVCSNTRARSKGLMTIAACFICPEGVVLGADSTASAFVADGAGGSLFHYFNHTQKVFEVGEDATVGILTWGWGSLDQTSYRTLVAKLADIAKNHQPPITSLHQLAVEWSNLVWPVYQETDRVKRYNQFATQPPHGSPAGPAGSPVPRTEAEEKEFNSFREIVVGFCLAGYWLPDRTPGAFTVVFDPSAAQPQPVVVNVVDAWGVPSVVRRMIFGIDDNVKEAILTGGKWQGNAADLDAVLQPHVLGPSLILPIREAVDYVHTLIHTTIKALKFSKFSQVCGGPVELAVITTDRRFRWVQHKSWDSAVEEL